MAMRVKLPKSAGEVLRWEDAKEVKTLYDEAGVNALLSTGKWVISDAGRSHVDNNGFSAKPTWMLIRVRD